MKRIILLAGMAAVLAAPVWGAEAVPSLVNFQGTLTDDEGVPLAAGTYTIGFRVWNKPAAGDEGEQLIWGRTYEVPLFNGRFNVILGDDSGAAIEGSAVNDIAYAFTESERYVGVTPTHVDGTSIEAAAELAPRQRVLSAPYALQARLALNGLPSGAIVPYAGPADVDQPKGFLPCDGREVDRTAYDGLFLAIGETWGAGDGVTTFNLPDLRGRSPFGAGQGQGLTARSLAQTGGEEAHVLSVAELPDHTHTLNDLYLGSGESGSFWVGGDHYYWWGVYDNEESTTGTTGAVGAAHENMPPFAALNYIIKY